MERLTKRLDTGWPVMDCDACKKAGNTCHLLECRNRLKDRLAEYEDTGLSPEDLDLGINAAVRKKVGAEYYGLTPEQMEHAVDLFCAEKEGRLVVLPCKVGDAVYRIYDDCEFPGDCYTKRKCKGCEYRNLFIEEQAFCISMLSQNGTLGRPYYLTREEAEAAMRKRKE